MPSDGFPFAVSYATCPLCAAEIRVAIAASTATANGRTEVLLAVSEMSGCRHVAGWRPDPDGGVPAEAA